MRPPGYLPLPNPVKDPMKQTLLVMAVVLAAALPVDASAQQQCYRITDSSPPPSSTPLNKTPTSCAATPAGTCWYQVLAGPFGLPPNELWVAAPSSWNFLQCYFFDYYGLSSGVPIVRYLVRSPPCSLSTQCNTQPPGIRQLDVLLDGTGTGSVSSNPSGISCPSWMCSASFAKDSLVTLTATQNTDSIFTGWSGGGCSGTGTCTVTMDAAKSVQATFASTNPCHATCSCTDSYGAWGETGPMGGATIIHLERATTCRGATVTFMAQGTTYSGGHYDSFVGSIDIQPGESSRDQTFHDYNWMTVDSVSILSITPW